MSAVMEQKLVPCPPIVYTVTGLKTVKKWCSGKKPLFVAVEDTGGVILSIWTDGVNVRVGGAKTWVSEMKSHEQKGVEDMDFVTRIRTMCKRCAGLGITSLTVYGQLYGEGLSAPLLTNARDFVVHDIYYEDTMQKGLLDHDRLVKYCQLDGIKYAQEIFTERKNLDGTIAMKITDSTMSKINPVMGVVGVLIKPVETRPRTLPVLRVGSIRSMLQGKIVTWTSKQHEMCAAIFPLLTKQLVRDFVHDDKPYTWDREKIARVVYHDAFSRANARRTDKFEPSMSLPSMNAVAHYLDHYIDSLLTLVASNK